MSLDAERFQELLKLWSQAEARLKRTERVRSALAIPAVNELRYTGYHLTEALAAGTESEQLEALAKAKRHCKRATYDAVEAEVLYWLTVYDKFREAYATLVLSEVAGLEWLKQERTVRGVRNFVRASGGESKDAHYEGLISRCDELVDVLDTCEAARDELNKLLRAREDDRAARAEQATAAADAAKKAAEGSLAAIQKAADDAAAAARKAAADQLLVTRRWRITTAIAAIAAIAAVGKVAMDHSSPKPAASAASVASPPPSH